MKNLIVSITLGVLIVSGSASCALRVLEKAPAPTVLEEEKLPYKVAILPFANKTANPEAGMIVRKMFYNFFSSLNYQDLEPFVIDENLKANQLYSDVTGGRTVSPQKLGQLLGVDAVIYGDVISLGRMYALLYSDSQAGLKAKMVRCSDAKPVWELEHTIHIEEGEVPLSPIGLASAVFKTALSHHQATHLKAASELCMQMIATMPNPPGVSEPPPKIQVLVHNGAGRLLQPGDTIKVAMIGEKNQIASWSIPPLIENLPMKEKQPGVYIGAYRIKARDRLAHGRMVGILRTKKGVGSQWMDTLGPVIIGKPTVLPPVIDKDYVLSIDKSPYLVTDALLVKPGAKLTMNAGTVIWFRSLGLIVKGQLEILGTQDDPVRLSSMGASSWKGIFLDRSRDNNQISYCTVSDAEYGFRASKSNFTIQNCQFQDNVWGIVMEESRGEISSSLIRTSAKSGIAARKAQLLVKDSVITENSSGGFLLEGSKARIEQNNILNNGGWEIKVLDKKGRVKAKKNWWGDPGPEKNEIIGPVAFQPALKSPIAFSVIE
ncbi:MAG: GNA1162 family protein [Desulfobacteraceae bacterium]|nr:GNA1162 family protein [Desulfobacteraceae bacterium]